MFRTLYLTVKGTFLWTRTLCAIMWSIVIQFMIFCMFVFIVNFDILHPLNSMLKSICICLSGKSVLAALPISVMICAQCFVYSGQYFTVPNYVGTRFARSFRLFALSNLVTTVLYMLIGGAIPMTYQFPFEGDYNSVFKKCQVSERYICMNEGGVFLLLNGLWTGLFFSVRNYFHESNMIVFPVVQQRIFLHLKSGLTPLLKQGFAEAIWPTMYFFLLYYLQGAAIREFVAGFLGLVLEPSLYDTILGLFHFKLIFYSLFFASVFVVIMNTMKLLLKIYLTRWFKFPVASTLSNAPAFTLHQAISCLQIPIIQYLGYHDLRTLSEKDTSRRQELFSLSIPGGHPYNWNLIVEECLRQLKIYTQNLNEASGEKFVSDKRNLSNVQPLMSQTLSNQSQNISLLRSPQLHTSVNTQQYSQYSSVYPSPNMSYIQSPIRRLESSFSEKHALHSMTLLQRESAHDVLKEYFNYYLEMLCKKPGISYLFSEMPDAKVRHYLRQGQPTVWIMESLSILSVASYKEDKYGVAQKDLAAIITTLLQLKQTLDKLQKLGNYKKAQKVENQELKMMVALRSSVRRALYRISITFGKHLKDLQLGKEPAQQIQNFVMFREA